jgi:hypothetical protein
MRTAVIITLVSSLLASPAVVRAEPATCVSGSPGSPACTEPAQFAPVAAGWQPAAASAVPQPAPVGDLSAVTHSFYLPTGNLTPAGKFSASVHEMGLFNTVAYGVSDHVEISAGAPAIPIVWSLGARLSLTSPDSPLRAVVGGSIWMPLVQESSSEFEYLRQGTLTLGYQTARWNIHGSLSVLAPNFDDDSLLMGSAGFVYKVGRKWALMADISTLDMTAAMSCSGDCSNPFPSRTASAGLKYMGRKWDVDFGLFTPILKEDRGTHLVIIPLVSLHRH